MEPITNKFRTKLLAPVIGLSALLLCETAFSACNVSDVQFGIPPASMSDADACHGPELGNDAFNNASNLYSFGSSDPWTPLAKWDWANGGGTFENKSIVVYDDNDPAAAIATINFMLAGGSVIDDFQTFDLLWNYNPIQQPGLIPALLDLNFAVKHSAGFAQYFFADQELVTDVNSDPPSGAGEGRFQVTFHCTGSENSNPNAGAGCVDADGNPIFSHLAVYGRQTGFNDEPPPPPQDIPEPGMLLLLGAGLAGLSLTRRRRS